MLRSLIKVLFDEGHWKRERVRKGRYTGYVSLCGLPAYSEHIHLSESQSTVTSYPRGCITKSCPTISFSLRPCILHHVLNFAFFSAKQTVYLEIFTRNPVHNVASVLVVVALQYRSGELGLVPQLHAQLRKHPLRRRPAQKHQRRLQARCNRCTPGSE